MARDSEGRAGGCCRLLLPCVGYVTEGLEGRLALELTPWSSPRAQEPLLPQQFT